MSLPNFDWRSNAKLPRAACFELHTFRFVVEKNSLIIGRPGTGKTHITKACGLSGYFTGTTRAT
jgi:DNA replication protein DnaC